MTTAKMKKELAFPSSHTDTNDVPVRGMTLRDYFAAQAMQGYIAGKYPLYPHEKAEEAYKIADAMLEERVK